MPGVTILEYVAMTGQSQDEFVETTRVTARNAVRADLALRAVVAQEGIEVSDEDVDAEIDQIAERLGEKPAKVRKDLERRGVVQAVRSELERGKALSFLIEHATVVDEDGNPVDLSRTSEDAPGRRRRPTLPWPTKCQQPKRHRTKRHQTKRHQRSPSRDRPRVQLSRPHRDPADEPRVSAPTTSTRGC